MTAYDAMDIGPGAFARYSGSPPSAWPGGAPGLERAAACGTGRSDALNRTGTSPGVAFVFAAGGRLVWGHRSRQVLGLDHRQLGEALRRAGAVAREGLSENTTIRPRAGRRSAHDADM
jgi:hypothetical protein